MATTTEYAYCGNCGKAIFRTHYDMDGDEEFPWYHVGLDHRMVRGCRAATWREGQGWDDSLDKRLSAEPAHG